jgi:quercetin dioxygenase-like cupin family protein
VNDRNAGSLPALAAGERRNPVSDGERRLLSVLDTAAERDAKIPAMRRCALFLFFSLLVTALLCAQSTPEVETTAEPHHHLALANDEVRVFNVEIAAHDATLMHRHRHDYIWIQLSHSEVVNAVQGKDPVTVKLQEGQTSFLSGGFAHAARNLSAQPYRSVMVEILQDDKLRQSPAHWNSAHPEEDRGLEILAGGTKEILFVKDGIRVSEFELQAGGVVPRHHHAGPFLVVALTDFELRNAVEGKSPVTMSMKQGESQWMAGGHSHIVTNSGHHPAKFVTLEFPARLGKG